MKTRVSAQLAARQLLDDSVLCQFRAGDSVRRFRVAEDRQVRDIRLGLVGLG